MANNNSIFNFDREFFARETNTRLKAILLNRVEKKFDIDLEQHWKNDPIHSDKLKYEAFVDMTIFTAIHELIDKHSKDYADFGHALDVIFSEVAKKLLSGRGDEVREEFKDDKIVGPFIADIHMLIAVINNIHEEEIIKLKITMELFGDNCLVAKEDDIEHVEVPIDKDAINQIIKGGQADSNG